MDQMQFDSLARRLGKRTNRRAGVLGAIGAMLGLAIAPDAYAARKATRRHEKLACRNANSQCISDAECCSNRCVPKFGGTEFRCAKRHANTKKKKGGKGGDAPAPLVCDVCASGCPYQTIEAAVADADAGAVITVGPGTYIPGTTIANGYSLIPINMDLTLEACDPRNRPVIDVSTVGDFFYIFMFGTDLTGSGCSDDEPVTVIIDGIDLLSTPDANHMAIFSVCNVDLTLRNSTISGFMPRTVLAPITIGGDSLVLIDRCLIHDNGNANAQGPSAITMFVTTTTADPMIMGIRDTLVEDNQGTNAAITMYGGGTLNLIGSTIVQNNTATYSNALGGGISAYVSLIHPLVVTLESTVTVTGNSAGTGTGGGIYAVGGGGATVTGATAQTVYGNTATTCNNYFAQPNCILS